MEQGINCERRGLDLGRDATGYGSLLAAQQGDRAAFQDLVQDYETLVLRVALNVTGSQYAAQQIYSRVFTEAFLSVNKLRPGSSVFLWVHRLLARHCLEYCRQHPHTVDLDGCEKDSQRRLLAAIRSLPPHERVILQLKHYQGLKVRTLAEIFDATPEFVIQSLQSANTHLQRQLRAEVSTLP